MNKQEFLATAQKLVDDSELEGWTVVINKRLKYDRISLGINVIKFSRRTIRQDDAPAIRKMEGLIDLAVRNCRATNGKVKGGPL